jgi:hypothetical protein
MSSGKDVLHIFHLYRKDGTAVFLHPFRRTERLHSILQQSDIRGHYGAEPRVESVTLFRNELYRLIEQEVKSWVSDTRFIPRFLIAAATFLVSYLFFAFVIRDPIPMVDELALASGISIAVYLLIGRRDLKSDVALKRRIAERSVVDRISFNHSDFVADMEAALISKETLKPEALREQILRPDSEIAVEGHEEEAAQFVLYLGRLFDSSEFRRAEKKIEKFSDTSDTAPQTNALKWAEARKIDMPLLALYFQLKRKVKTESR